MMPNGMLASEKLLSAGMESQDLRGAIVCVLMLLMRMERWDFVFFRSCRSGFRMLVSIERLKIRKIVEALKLRVC